MDSLYSSIEEQMIFYCQIVPQDVELRTNTYLQLHMLELMANVETPNPSVAFSGHVQASELRNESRLTGTVRTQEAKQLSFVDFKVDVIIRNFRLRTSDARVDLAHVLDYKRVLPIIFFS